MNQIDNRPVTMGDTMNKTFRILQLINLLYHRKYVTLKMIRETCGIPERTAYRYITTISEANIPVYFDEAHRAYSLSRRPGVPIDDLTLNDAVILLLGLRSLGRHVNGKYRKDIERLTTKLLVRQGTSIERIIPAIEAELDSHDDWPELSETLSNALLHAAIAVGKGVRLQTRDTEREEQAMQIDKPALVFDHCWQVAGVNKNKSRSAKLTDVESVTIR
jgi:predicted DNA-binding transcriptional regulator YafY